MPLCHQCEWYRRPPDEAKRTACLACPGPSENLTHKGRTHVSIDAGGAQTAAAVEAALQEARNASDSVYIDEDDPETKVAMAAGGLRVLLYIKGLTKEQIVLLWYVLREGSLANVARDLKCTRAMVSHLWRGMLAARPELAAVLDGGGPAPEPARETARATRPAAVQADLFDGLEGGAN